MTANFHFIAPPLNFQHPLAFHQHDLTAPFSHATSLNRRKVDAALTQPDDRLIRKINNPQQTSSSAELLIPTLTFAFSACDLAQAVTDSGRVYNTSRLLATIFFFFFHSSHHRQADVLSRFIKQTHGR